jgi:hypothetical protein
MTPFITDPRNPTPSTSAATANDAYKRSWCGFFLLDCGKTTEEQKTTGRLVDNDVAVEILKNRIPTATCKSLRKKLFGFRTFSTSPAIHNFRQKGNTGNAIRKPVLI